MPDPQPPAPEASEDELVKTISRVLSYAITEDGSSQQARDALKALAARLREAEQERNEENRKAWHWIEQAKHHAEHREAAEARVRELEAALEQADQCCARPPGVCFSRALLGSGEGQERQT